MTTPDPMSAFALTNYRTLGVTDDSECFTATITQDGRPIATVSNDGHGGCHLYRPRDAESMLHTAARAWATHYGDPEMFECLDFWVYWTRYLAPTGVSAHDAIQALHASVTAMIAQVLGPQQVSP